ncbi:hypothetical protein GSI_11410 [Ganoderma sinense ZZ0214-1]|uniref:Uncharacterized protein n=1 Tax=Ganoderma sinense ZZ0214-1 TaxID=1077348 RepID=A0A2G8RVW9_9APHY|nr:hypothetical protein GSI_11410 [Ganoderma sinense ZZ0214-1]
MHRKTQLPRPPTLPLPRRALVVQPPHDRDAALRVEQRAPRLRVAAPRARRAHHPRELVFRRVHERQRRPLVRPHLRVERHERGRAPGRRPEPQRGQRALRGRGGGEG